MRHFLHRLSAALSGAGVMWALVGSESLVDKIVRVVLFAGAFLAQTNWREFKFTKTYKREQERKRRHDGIQDDLLDATEWAMAHGYRRRHS
jgi:hypothetical protein